MLTKAHRLTSSRGFVGTIRRGRRAGTKTLVLHLDCDPGRGEDSGPLVGFVVSKAVGNAVSRNQVKRRLRHLARERLSSLPGSCVLVVRALPGAARASSARLGADLDTALARLADRGRRTDAS
ncbi:MAG: ribonuclease P protein component [Nocardioidaceae bacterium]